MAIQPAYRPVALNQCIVRYPGEHQQPSPPPGATYDSVEMDGVTFNKLHRLTVFIHEINTYDIVFSAIKTKQYTHLLTASISVRIFQAIQQIQRTALEGLSSSPLLPELVTLVLMYTHHRTEQEQHLLLAKTLLTMVHRQEHSPAIPSEVYSQTLRECPYTIIYAQAAHPDHPSPQRFSSTIFNLPLGSLSKPFFFYTEPVHVDQFLSESDREEIAQVMAISETLPQPPLPEPSPASHNEPSCCQWISSLFCALAEAFAAFWDLLTGCFA